MKMRTPAVVVSATAALVLAGAVAVVAQEPSPAPDVAVKVTPKSITLTGADALKTGATRFVMSSSGKNPRGVLVVRLKDGVTRAEAAEAAPKIKGPAEAERKLGRFVASTMLIKGQQYATTTELAEGEYVVLDITRTPAVRAGFTVGAEPSSATMPATNASIVASDYRFRLPDGLPREGPFLVENRGRKLHHVLAYPVKSGVPAGRIVRNLLADKTRYLTGAPAAVTEIVSGGTANAVEGRFRKGRILLVCFLNDGPGKKSHAALGMYKAVTVK